MQRFTTTNSFCHTEIPAETDVPMFFPPQRLQPAVMVNDPQTLLNRKKQRNVCLRCSHKDIIAKSRDKRLGKIFLFIQTAALSDKDTQLLAVTVAVVSNLVLVTFVVTMMSVRVMDVDSVTEMSSVMASVMGSVSVAATESSRTDTEASRTATETSNASTEELAESRCESNDREDEELDAHVFTVFEGSS